MRILIVDNDARVVGALTAYLSARSHCVHAAISSRSACDSTPHRRSQFRSMTESTPLGPADPVSFIATVCTTSSDIMSGSGVGTASYGSKAPFSLSTFGSRRAGCFERSTSMTGKPVFESGSSGLYAPPPPVSRD